jgi:hypothetical protein
LSLVGKLPARQSELPAGPSRARRHSSRPPPGAAARLPATGSAPGPWGRLRPGARSRLHRPHPLHRCGRTRSASRTGPPAGSDPGPPAPVRAPPRGRSGRR